MRFRKYNKSLGWMLLIVGIVLFSGCDFVFFDLKGQIGLE